MKNITAQINHKVILKDINLDLSLGEYITIIGPNGSGKSTLIKLINRSLYPLVEKNSIFEIFNQTNINLWDLRSNISFVHNDIHKRIGKNIKSINVVISGLDGTIGNPRQKTQNKSNIDKARNIMCKLSLIKLEEVFYTDLSDGQQRKLLITRALINDPKVLILDEPFIGLDIKSKYSIIDFINQLSKEGITILLVTNNLDNISNQSNKILCMKSGRIFKQGIPSEILKPEIISNLFDTNVKLFNSNGFWRTIPNT